MDLENSTINAPQDLTPLRPEDVRLYHEWQFSELRETIEGIRRTATGVLELLDRRHERAGEMAVRLAEEAQAVANEVKILASLPALMARENGAEPVERIHSVDEWRAFLTTMREEEDALVS